GNSTLDADSGNLTLNGATLTGNDTIAGTVNTTIGANGVTISNTSADGIILNNGDTINGTVNQQGGNLSLDGVTTNGKLNSASGKLTLDGTTIEGNDTIAGTVNTTIGVKGVNIQGTGTEGVTLTDQDRINGQIKQTGGILNLNNATVDGHLYSESG